MTIRKKLATDIRILLVELFWNYFVELILKGFFNSYYTIIKLAAFYFVGYRLGLDQTMSWLWRWAGTDNGK